MNSNNLQILPLKEAAEKFQTEDINEFRRGMKRAGCVVTIAGVDMIDMVKLQQRAAQKSQGTGSKTRSKRTPNPMGLLKARVGMYPRWIDNKNAAIDSFKMKVAEAPNPYEKNQAHKKLTKLQTDLKKMEENYKRDQDKLDKISNASQFGSYVELVKINKFNYKNPKRQ